MATSGAFTTTMNTMDGALRLWREIVRGLEAAGYGSVVPEYLKLSRSLSHVRMTELLQGEPEAEHWIELRNLAMQALKNLDPLVEAARILAQLPTELRETVRDTAGTDLRLLPPEPEPSLANPEPDIAAEEPEPVSPVSETATSLATATRKRRSSEATQKVVPLLNRGKSKRKKAVVAKLKVSAGRRRVKSRD